MSPYHHPSTHETQSSFSLVKWLLRKGIVQTEVQANGILIAIIIICILLVISLNWPATQPVDPTIPPEAYQDQMLDEWSG